MAVAGRRGFRVSRRMNWKTLFHILVFASLLSGHVYTAVSVHYTGLPAEDYSSQYYYINDAVSIFHGSYFAPTQPVEIAPLYPLWLSTLMHMSPAFANFLECADENRQATGLEKEAICRSSDNLALYAQAVLGAVGIGLAWLAGWLASGRFMIAHLSAFVALVVDDYAFYNTQFRTESLVIPLFAGVNVCLAWLALRRERKWRTVAVAVGCGVMLGGLILTRPPYEYLLTILPCTALAHMMFQERSRRREIAVAAACILICASLVVTPWIVRNYMDRGFVGFTETYAPEILVQRINFNAMTREQWTAAWLVWSFSRGRILATELFGSETVAPLIYFHPEFFEKQRTGPELLTGVALKDQLGVLAAHVWSDLPKHMVVSAPLAWRGMNKFRPSAWLCGITPIWGMILLVAIFVSLARGTRQNRTVLLALTFCPIVILAIHALVSVNTPRYNIGLVTPLSVAAALPIAWVIDGAWNRLRRWIPWTRAHQSEPPDTPPDRQP